MSKKTLAAAFGAFILLAEPLAFSPSANANPVCRTVDGTGVVCREGNRITWTIQDPNVNQAYLVSPKIRVRSGDRVVVDAGGCVQTGGSGKTWKRYVNPSPSDKYYGTIHIPGATNGNVPISSILGQELTVGAINGSQPIGIGYVDDSYGDNGYYNRNSDNGTGNQCRGLGSAYIILTINR